MRKNKSKRVGLRILSFIVTAVIFYCLSVGVYFFIEKRVYPLDYITEIKYYSNKYGLDVYKVLSLIKIESNFNAEAVSLKGAKGLMQLIDSTAYYVAEKLGKKNFDLFNAKDNIELGCYYLKYLSERFDIEKTALCAYNAGEGNVRIWLSEKSFSDDGRTLKFIPFKETREYIIKFEKTFNKYKKLYKNLLDKQKNIEYYK